MAKQIITFLLSFLMPGLGYLQVGDKKKIYIAISIFFTVLILVVTCRLFTTFSGLSFVIVSLFALYLFTALHSAIKAKSTSSKIRYAGFLKISFTIFFVLVTSLSFANRRVVMGFDILSMNVPVMQPTVFQNEKFLLDTWAYQNQSPERGDIVAHSFNLQKGLYLNRIVAKGDDRIEIKNGVVILNGHALHEMYVLSENVTKAESKYMVERTIPKGHYFVMGDNRDASFGDSRFNGTIVIGNIEGKITEIISSIDKARIGVTVE